MKEIPFALRMLRRNPGFSAIIILTLGLGIGLNTAIFTNINATLLRPLPYPAPEQLVVVQKDWKPEWAPHGEVSPLMDCEETIAWQEHNTVFSQLAAYLTRDVTLSGSEGAELVNCTQVSASFLPLFGMRPSLGRGFLPEEDRPGGPPVAILSFGLWQSRFGGSTQVLGQTITVDDKPYAVIGISPSNFQFIKPFDLLVPLALTQGKSGLAQVIGRLKPGMSIEQARANLDAIYQQVRKPSGPGRVLLTPLREQLVGHMRSSLLIYLGAAGLVLLIACANVANLLLARGAGRRKELAIRTALGAGRFQIMRLLLTESLVLALLGALVGLLLAHLGNGLLRPFMGSLPTMPPPPIDGSVLAFTLLLALLTGLVSASFPPGKPRALRSATRSKTAPAAADREAAISVGSRRSWSPRKSCWPSCSLWVPDCWSRVSSGCGAWTWASAPTGFSACGSISANPSIRTPGRNRPILPR